MENGIRLDEYRKTKGEVKMIKYNVFIVIILGLLLMLLLLAGRFGPDTIPFIIFVIFAGLPILITFRNSIPNYIPQPIRDFIVIDDPDDKINPSSILDKTRSTKARQILFVIGISIITIGVLILIRDVLSNLDINSSNVSLTKNGTLKKIIMGVLLTIINGVLLMKFNELSNDFITNQ
jgi:hypothetical protein